MNNKPRTDEAKKEISRRLMMSNNRRVESIRFAEMSCSDDTARKPKLSNPLDVVNEPRTSLKQMRNVITKNLWSVSAPFANRTEVAINRRWRSPKIPRVGKGNCSHGWICNNRTCENKVSTLNNEKS